MKIKIIMCVSLAISMLSVTQSYAAEAVRSLFDMELENFFVSGCRVLKVSSNNERKWYFPCDELKMAKKQLFQGKEVRLLTEEEAKEYCIMLEATQANSLVPMNLFDTCRPFWIKGASDEVFNVFSPTQMKGGPPAPECTNCIKFIVVDSVQAEGEQGADTQSMWSTLTDMSSFCSECIAPHCTPRNAVMGMVVCAVAGGGGYALYKYGYAAGVASVGVAGAVNNVPGFSETARQTYQVVRNAGGVIFRLWCPAWLRRGN